MTDFEQPEGQSPLLRKAINLFTFLRSTQQLLAKPIRTVDKFEQVLWFAGLPHHPGVQIAAPGDAAADEAPALLAVARVPKFDPPAVPAVLKPWVDGVVDDVDREPTLREWINAAGPSVRGADGYEESADLELKRVGRTELPEVDTDFHDWLADWRRWARVERRDAPVRDFYKQLFAVHLDSTDHVEEFELILGLGLLSWNPDGYEPVRRHVATAPLSIVLDENSGMLTVLPVPAPEALTLELDMLDPALITSPVAIDEIRSAAALYDGHLMDRDGVGAICRRLIHRLDPDAEYDPEGLAPPTTGEPHAAFAPALILRRRTNRGLMQIYQQIVAQLQTTGEVPDGVLPLVDPDRQPDAQIYTGDGALVNIDGEDFFPLPLNDKQRSIIERVDRTAQTVVQGPPGTGKTYTAAALVSHLLAQGKRILITAHTDRALREVRAKLPREIQSLAVSVIGNSRSDMADLRVAVDTISHRADDFDARESQRSIDACLARLDELRGRRADAYHRLIAIRRQEVETRDDGPEPGTLAAIAHRHLQQEDEFGWIQEFDIDPDGSGHSISSEEMMRWRAALLNSDVIANEPEARSPLPTADELPEVAQFAGRVQTEQQAIVERDRYNALFGHESFPLVRSLDPIIRGELRRRISDLADRAARLEHRQESWMGDALRDVRSGRRQMWRDRSAQIASLAAQATALIAKVGPARSIAVLEGDVAAHQQTAKSLLAHLDTGKGIKTSPDGTPKIGAFTAKTVKLAEPFFAHVRINGLPAVSSEQLVAFSDWVDVGRIVAAMDQAWPTSVQIPDEDTFDEKVSWHRTEVAQLDKALALGEQIDIEHTWLAENDLPVPDWNDLAAIRRYATMVEAADAVDRADAARAPLETLCREIKAAGPTVNPAPVITSLVAAVTGRDVIAYAAARERLAHLKNIADLAGERDRIRAELDRSAPDLASTVGDNPAAVEWDSRLPAYEWAWRWEMTGRWILAQDSEDSNVLKVRLNALEQQIRSEVEHLAAERAWRHAVAPDRLTGSARANLTQYAQLVARLGKGTGKFATKQRAAIADAMDRCRPSVPVWIMPIYRIAEQMRVRPDLFDVVIVDEASQAGLEASFLQYLAPKIVVIGDDKQVSPAAVGVDQQQLRDLANLYLADDLYKESWLDPKRSYFDEANMRFGGRITLTEHRRCMPEIIGFSNRIAYEPEGIRLEPVRQFGGERLDPVKVIYVPDGFEATNKTNPVEAQAIVDQIRKCLAEPAYDGATFGVISLLGKEQAKLIEGKLLDAVPPEEWTARGLRCGDASDFQGSECDVMFLSMVKAPNPERRFVALTMSQYVQRFNVAASRAKDQMWVYHSMPREALGNPEDMRYQLLDYCYGVANRSVDAQTTRQGPVPEDDLVAPFDSLFEQRVFNRIHDRGYTVVPQYPAQGYRIDLVIVGAKARLAVECDGDTWHGPDQYESDLARQRELERCGWDFFRIRESLFYADMAGSLQDLWDTLGERDIRTADWASPGVVEDKQVEAQVDAESSGAVPDDPEPIVEDFEPGIPLVLDSARADAVLPNSGIDGESHGRHRLPDREVDEPLPDCLGSQAAPVAPHPSSTATVAAGEQLQHYVSFDEALPPIAETTATAMSAIVVRIVAAEGPILGHRLHQVYVKAAGGRRVGREIARVLNRAIMAAERRKEIVSDNPLGEAGVKPKTFRLASQEQVVARELGPRTLEDVPPAELAYHLNMVSVQPGELTEDELFREVLELLGLKRLTENAKAVLRAAKKVADIATSADGSSAS